MTNILATSISTIQREGIKEITLNSKTELKQFRESVKDKDITEINLIYRAGKYIIKVINQKLNRLQMIDAGLIKGTKKEKAEYEKLTETPKSKKQNLGYSWQYIINSYEKDK